MPAAAKAISHGREMCNMCLYGFLLVNANSIKGIAISCWKTRPDVTAAINRARSRTMLDTSEMSATETRIKLSTPTGVVLKQR